jgi:hypothetical protein
MAADFSGEVKAAAKKLADRHYSWTTKSESARSQQQGQGQPRPGSGDCRGAGFGAPPPADEKDGFTVLTYKNGDNTTEPCSKAAK